MLLNLTEQVYKSYGFRFKGSHQDRIAGLYSIGLSKEEKHTYDWNGLHRLEENVIVFQYTLKGAGEIRVGDATHSLNPGTAFFVKIPSDHRYYLPKSSSKWEFIHLTLFGEEALSIYETITKKSGHIFQLDQHTPPIALVEKIFQEVINKGINDAYIASAFAYQFLMELQRYTLNLQEKQTYPAPISKAISYIKKHYADQIGLDDIVHASGLSKYHFTRLFQQYVHITPIQYLTKIRINHSVNLLKNTQYTIHEIAVRVGFSNGNYFGKVFRSERGVSPGTYRNSNTFIPMDHFIGDY